MDPRQVPGVAPLAVHFDEYNDIRLLYPDFWQAYDMPGGKLFALPGTTETFISVEISSHPTHVTAADLPELEKGFLQGLRRAPKSKLLDHGTFELPFAVGLEAKQLYDGKKRWIKLLFREEMQVRLVAQGRTEDEFDYWLPAFEPAMTSMIWQPALPDSRV